jgi:hypothetical protein
MSLRARLDRLRERLRPPVCPEHLPDPRPRAIDYREGMEILCPDPERRAAAEARQEEEIRRVLATPPCATCGWRPPPPTRIRALDYGDVRGTHEPEPTA